jgi:cellulose synthase/poly-beta-1,6-N-acetylglucosamine synthase-like glycosyltransferase
MNFFMCAGCPSVCFFFLLDFFACSFFFALLPPSFFLFPPSFVGAPPCWLDFFAAALPREQKTE